MDISPILWMMKLSYRETSLANHGYPAVSGGSDAQPPSLWPSSEEPRLSHTLSYNLISFHVTTFNERFMLLDIQLRCIVFKG